MWVSSSAFEKSLNSSFCLDPSVYGWRVDPHGKYVKKYIPELAAMPVEFIYAPWRAPLEVACIQYLGISKHRHSGLWTINYNICFQVQKRANCIVGRDYPSPIVDHKTASQHNSRNMEELQKLLLTRCNMEEPDHIKPSNENEVKKFFNIDPSEELRRP